VADALATDVYELAMMAGYYQHRHTGLATFELVTRHLPPGRSLLIAAGLEQALDYLERLAFDRTDIEYMRSLPILTGISPSFFEEILPHFRFSGEVWAIEEGTPVFPQEPILRVTAPLPEAQLVETALLAIVSYQTSVASKAIRVVESAAGRLVIDYGARRAHGIDSALHAARAAYLAGCDATSYTDAGRRFGIPVSGTMAHSWVMSFADELDAFRKFSSIYGDRSVLLVDTYDTVAAVDRLIASGLKPAALRLDSGDVVHLSRIVRHRLDGAGLRRTQIVVSGDLDEYKIADIVAAGAPVDAFGVGAAIVTSSDAPSLGTLYKLVEVERGGQTVGVMKLSPDKRTLPGRKQVWRRYKGDSADSDFVMLADEPGPEEAAPLLQRVMVDGRRQQPARSLEELRLGCREALDRMPIPVRGVRDGARYPIRFSDALMARSRAGNRSAGTGTLQSA
jgi:nicotinate phosphoribosyltransferase